MGNVGIDIADGDFVGRCVGPDEEVSPTTTTNIKRAPSDVGMRFSQRE